MQKITFYDECVYKIMCGDYESRIEWTYPRIQWTYLPLEFDTYEKAVDEVNKIKNDHDEIKIEKLYIKRESVYEKYYKGEFEELELINHITIEDYDTKKCLFDDEWNKLTDWLSKNIKVVTYCYIGRNAIYVTIDGGFRYVIKDLNDLRNFISDFSLEVNCDINQYVHYR